MRKSFICALPELVALSALCVSSCTEVAPESVSSFPAVEITAGSPSVKTSINDLSVLWTADDKIGFYGDNIESNAGSVVKSVSEGGKSAKVDLPSANISSGSLFAYYPYTAVLDEDGNVVASIASEQDGNTGKWGYMYSTANYSSIEDLQKSGLAFKHLCAYIDLQLRSSNYSGCAVTKVVLSSLDAGKSLTGAFSLNHSGDVVLTPVSEKTSNQVSIASPVSSLTEEWQGKCLVVYPEDLSDTRLKITVTVDDFGEAYTQTKVIDGIKLSAGDKVTLKLNIDNKTYEIVDFADPIVESIVVGAFGANGVFTKTQAAAVTDDQMRSKLLTSFRNTQITSFDELKYFTGLTQLFGSVFNGCSKLTSVTLPSAVNALGNNSFQGCSSLKSIDLANIKTIGERAFRCPSLNSSLEKVGYTKNLTSVGQYAFDACSKLQFIDLSNLESLGQYAFNNCSALTNVNSDLKGLDIPAYAFSGCSNLVAEVELTGNVAEYGFAYCEKLKVKNLSDMKVVSDHAFVNCYSISGEVNLTRTTSIGPNAFAYTGISGRIRLPRVESIGTDAFRGTQITELDLTSAPLEILNGFYWCENLTKVTVSASVKTVAANAFGGENSVTEYHFLSAEPPVLGDNALTGRGYKIYVPAGSKDKYAAESSWAKYVDKLVEE